MNKAAPSKVRKFSIALLFVVIIHSLFGIYLFFSNFLVFPPTAGDLKYAAGFLYMPLAMVAIALGALLLKLRPGASSISRMLAWVGFILSAAFMTWWTVFNHGTLPMVISPVIFLAVVINDRRERKEANSNEHA